MQRRGFFAYLPGHEINTCELLNLIDDFFSYVYFCDATTRRLQSKSAAKCLEIRLKNRVLEKIANERPKHI